MTQDTLRLAMRGHPTRELHETVNALKVAWQTASYDEQDKLNTIITSLELEILDRRLFGRAYHTYVHQPHDKTYAMQARARYKPGSIVHEVV